MLFRSTALAIATAIDMALQNAQLVTVAVLDARFTAFEARIDARFAAAEAKTDARFVALEAKTDARFAAVDARFVALEAKMDARFVASEARMDAALQKTKAAELARWVYLVMLGNVALSVAANAVLNALQHLH